MTAGIDFHHRTGFDGQYWNPEIATGGVALLDYDRDGHIDLYCVQGGSLTSPSANPPGNRLYRNRGDGTFEDATERAGVGDRGYGIGCACGDIDNDGDTDLYVTNVGPNVLYRNNGDGTFTDITEQSGTGHPGWGTSAAFVDTDRDGNLDLCLVNYVRWSREREVACFTRGGIRDYCSPMTYQAPAPDTLYRNLGGGRFEDVSAQAGLHRAYGNGFGVAPVDFTGDGWVDLYIANDAMPNQLWVNQRDGTFRDEAMIRGCAVNRLGMPEAGMGVVVLDADANGLPDLFLTHLAGESNTLYLNENGLFDDTVTPQGPGASSWPFTGFGVAAADFDHDGHLDLYIANGRVRLGPEGPGAEDPYAEPNQLLAGGAAGAFRPVLPGGGTRPSLVATSRGLAAGDIDNDGDVDLVVVNRDHRIHLLRNLAPKRGGWVQFQCLNRHGSDAIGAVVEIRAGTRIQRRWVQPAFGYCSSQDPRVHAHLDPNSAAEVTAVQVTWPSGSQEFFGPFDGNRIHTLQEGAGSKSATAAAR